MQSQPDETGVFFVAFDSSEGRSKLKYSLQMKSTAGSPDVEDMPVCWDALDVRVPPGLSGVESDKTLVYRIKRDDSVLLRPPDNSEVPRIGRVIAIFSSDDKAGGADRSEACQLDKTALKKTKQKATPGSLKARLRVRWYYHASDFHDKPSRATGEDELLETPHFNDIDAMTIVGRCTVSSYQDYRRYVDNDKVNSSAVPVLEDVGNDAKRTDKAKEDCGEEDDVDDAASSFGDNYASASTRYFVREFYDACLDRVAIMQFEDPLADPAADIDNELDSDGSCVNGARLEGESDTEDSDFDDVDDVGDYTDPKPKRKRKRRRIGTCAPIRPPRPSRDDASRLQYPVPNIDIQELLPCRDSEKKAVAEFLRGAIEGSAKSASAAGRCLYISGVPGTGKTATVREIIGQLRGLLKDGSIAPFEAIEVNGMTLADPTLLYSELYAAIVGSRGVSPSRAQLLLEQRFASMDELASGGGTSANAREQGKCVVVVLDEMDVLVSRNEELLHRVLDWSARPKSRLALIGIANTMDLPERLLAKSKSRMGDKRLTYPPYTKTQLIEILNLRLRDKDIQYASDAIMLASAKIASLSGDVRRALRICSRAAALAREAAAALARTAAIDGTTHAAIDGTTHVTAAHISQASEDMSAGARFVTVARRPPTERLVLIATLVLSRSMGAFDADSVTSVPAVFRRSRVIAEKHKKKFEGTPATEELRRAVSRLVASRILLLERDSHGVGSRVVVNMSPDDVLYALSENAIAKAELQEGRR